MDMLEKMKKELVSEWNRIGLLKDPHTRQAALRAYYEKLARYKRQREFELAL